MDLPIHNASTHEKWVLKILEVGNQEALRMKTELLWGIWNQRNAKLWKDGCLTPQLNVQAMAQLIKEWDEAKGSNSSGGIGGSKDHVEMQR